MLPFLDPSIFYSSQRDRFAFLVLGLVRFFFEATHSLKRSRNLRYWHIGIVSSFFIFWNQSDSDTVPQFAVALMRSVVCAKRFVLTDFFTFWSQKRFGHGSTVCSGANKEFCVCADRFVSGGLLSYTFLPFITVGAYERRRKLALIGAALVLTLALLTTLLLLLYVWPIQDSAVIQTLGYLNCIPLTRDFCAEQNIHFNKREAIVTWSALSRWSANRKKRNRCIFFIAARPLISDDTQPPFFLNRKETPCCSRPPPPPPPAINKIHFISWLAAICFRMQRDAPYWYSKKHC